MLLQAGISATNQRPPNLNPLICIIPDIKGKLKGLTHTVSLGSPPELTMQASRDTGAGAHQLRPRNYTLIRM
jgi:hypothetical protein